MNWEERMLRHAPADLVSAVRALREEQYDSWPALRQGIDALNKVEYRSVVLEGVETFLQYNPQRIISSSAKVDQMSIAKRPCFLCSENMPVEEKVVRFDDRFVIAFNPMPILDWHLVALHIDHTPQRIEGWISSLLNLAARLKDEFVVIYNGAKCGASAPDHMHFQAAKTSRLPVLEIAARREPDHVAVVDGVSITAPSGYPTRILQMTGDNQSVLEGTLTAILRVLHEVQNKAGDEPMINLLARRRKSSFDIFVFSRSKHRPDSYFGKAGTKRMISPAAFDLAGIVIAPEHRDFVEIGPAELLSLLKEVTVGEVEFAEVRRRIARELS